MLVLSRKNGEVLRIGEEISIKILGINGQHVRIGILAPEETKVFREELYLRLKRESAKKRKNTGNE